MALTLVLPLTAQSGRGVITGVVTDSSGGTVSSAEIIVTNKVNGVETKTYTTHSGVYRVAYLAPDLYRVSASAQGFRTAVKDNIDVFVTQTVTANFNLEIGEITEHVTVSAESPLLEADTMEIGTNATLKEVQNWPIIVSDGTRQLQSFVFRAMPGTQGNEFAGSINGGQSFSHEILIDGISLGRMDVNGGSMNEFTPTMDAVNEFKLQTGALSAQYGSTQTAVASFGLRSGSNLFHGSLFEFHTNSALNANSWGANRQGISKQPKLQNNFGGTFGGPIVKNRTHFFVSYEGHRFRDHTVTGDITVPLPEYKTGNFARLFDPSFTGSSLSGTVVGRDALGREIRYGQIYDPTTSRQLPNGAWVRDPFPSNIVPKDRYSSVTSRILAKHDVPDPSRQTFRFNHPRIASAATLDIDNVSFKFDHVLTSRHKIAASVVNNDRTRSFYGSAAMFGVALPGPAMLGSRTQYTPGWIVRLSEDWTLGSDKLNHFALGYNRFRNRNASGVFQERDWAAELGLQGVGGATFPLIFFQGTNATLGGGLGSYGSGASRNSPNGSVIVQNDFTWLHGSHSLKFGGEHRRYYLNDRDVIDTGQWTFHSQNSALPGFQNQTGFAYASFLLGAARNANLDLPFVTLGIRSRSTHFYFQDNWKFTPKVMLNLGIRWDIPQPLGEVAHRMSSLDPNLPNPAAGGRPGALVFLGDCQGCTGKSSFADTYCRQLAPRVGFAYAVKEKVVVRAGYGINFSPPILDGFAFPYAAGFNGSNPILGGRGRFTEDVAHYWDTPYPRFPLNLPDTNPSLLNGFGIGYYLPEAQMMPYVQNWNLGIQYELPWQTRIEANYIGNKGTRLNESLYGLHNLNQADPRFLSLGDALLDDIALHPEIPSPFPGFQGTVGQSLRPFPQYQGISTHRLNNGWSNYHSVQVTVTKRSNHGLSFLAAYTFSKSLGTSDSAGVGDYSYGGQDLYNRRADYSVTSFNFPQDLKLSWIYDLPFGPQGRWFRSGALAKVLGGWSASAIHRYQSGAPLAITSGNWDASALGNAGLRPDVLLPHSQQVIAEKPEVIDVQNGSPFLNPVAFADPPKTSQNVPIRLGNAPRYLPNLRGFAAYSEDLALTKRTSLGFREGASLEIRIDAINALNRVGLQNPNTSLFDLQYFGRILGKTNSPRNVQVGVRLNF